MVEPLRIGSAGGSAMKRQVIASAAQVGVVGIGPPYELHPEDAFVKLPGAIDVGNAEGKMAQSSIRNHD